MSGAQERAFAAAIKAHPGRPEDTAIQSLARRLARLIDRAATIEREINDDAEDIIKRFTGEALVVAKLSAEYRQALTALELTPAARGPKNVKGGDVHEHPVNPLEAARDAARARRTAAGHPPAP